MERNTYKRLTSLVKSLPTKQSPGPPSGVAENRHRGDDMSSGQQVWTACWSALVIAGWSSLRVGWYLHHWFHKSRPRGYLWQAKVLKGLSHAVRAGALHATEVPEVKGIRKNVVNCLVSLARRHPKDGFAFSRMSRVLPLPPKEVKEEAMKDAVRMLKTPFSMSEWAKKDLFNFVASGNVRRQKTRSPKALPSTNSSCIDWPASRGGLDGYLRHLGTNAEIQQVRWDTVTKYATDRLGAYLLSLAKVVMVPCQGVADNLDEAYRAAGVLLLRKMRAEGLAPPRSRLDCLLTPGLKARVIGVPDALTFIEGSWVRRSADLMAPGHWYVTEDPQGFPRQMNPTSPCDFTSADLSKATDGLSHDAVRTVIKGLVSANLILRSEEEMALRSLGVGETPMIWSDGKDEFIGVRGSPMGTPLSFVVLSWVNAWAAQAFKAAVHHGDDLVGCSRKADSKAERKDYKIAISLLGATLNEEKSYVSSDQWTMCEVLAHPKSRYLKDGMKVFIPPPLVPPGTKAPIMAEARTELKYMKRQERIVKTLFPWVIKDVRLHLPVEIGGFGYLGRGLAVGRGVRSRLGALVSRDPDLGVGTDFLGKLPFRAAGLFPTPLVPVYKPKTYWDARKTVKSYGLTSQEGVRVPLEKFVIFESILIENEMRHTMDDKFKRVRRSGRPARTKSGAVFRRLKVATAKPLSKWGGIASLKRWVSKVKALEITVPEDVALEIPGWNPSAPKA